SISYPATNLLFWTCGNFTVVILFSNPMAAHNRPSGISPTRTARPNKKEKTFMGDPKAVMEFVKKHDVKLLDLRFTDLPGLWHHVSYPIDQFSEASFEEGFGMDGSSIRGWNAIHESDMLLMPDPTWFM